MSLVELSVAETTPQILMDSLEASGRAKVGGWYFSLDEYGIWMTNPYGLDVGVGRPCVEQCQFILEMIIASQDRCERGYQVAA